MLKVKETLTRCLFIEFEKLKFDFSNVIKNQVSCIDLYYEL